MPDEVRTLCLWLERCGVRVVAVVVSTAGSE